MLDSPCLAKGKDSTNLVRNIHLQPVDAHDCTVCERCTMYTVHVLAQVTESPVAAERVRGGEGESQIARQSKQFCTKLALKL